MSLLVDAQSVDGFRTISSWETKQIPKEIRDLEALVGLFKVENYGFGDLLYKDVRLSRDHGFPEIYIPFPEDMSHYDCHIAMVKVQEAVANAKPALDNFKSEIMVGPDMYGLFDKHFYSVFFLGKPFRNARKLLVDAVPIFPFFGAEHPEGIVSETTSVKDLKKTIAITFNNNPPLTTIIQDGCVYTSNLRIHTPRMRPSDSLDYRHAARIEPQTMYGASVIEMIYSISKLENRKVSRYSLLFRIDYDRFIKFIRGGQSSGEFSSCSGRDVFNLLLSQGIMTVVDDVSEGGFIYRSRREFFQTRSILSFEGAQRSSIFRRDVEHIGNYARACLLHYRWLNQTKTL